MTRAAGLAAIATSWTLPIVGNPVRMSISHLVHQVTNRPAHEGTVDMGGFRSIRQVRGDLVGRIPVRGIIVFTAEEIVVNSR
jgi:hypothetical protein